MKKIIALATLFTVSAPAFSAVMMISGKENFQDRSGKTVPGKFTGRVGLTEVYTSVVKQTENGAIRETTAVAVTVESGANKVMVKFTDKDIPIGVNYMASEGKDAAVRVDAKGEIIIAVGSGAGR